MRLASIVNVYHDTSDDPKSISWSPAEDPDSRTARKRKRVIIVDDDALIAESLADILNGEGFEATAVFSGQDAIDWARKTAPDVVVSDVLMPEMTGIEAAKSIREFLPQCRIILFSGQALTSDLLADARAQGHTFEMLGKPVSPYMLIEALRSKSKQ
jgi:CheY-like chemotaxis protein